MAFAQSRYQPDVLRGPQGRQARLNGITMAAAEIEGCQLIAGPVPGGGIEAPMAGCLSGHRPARTA
jgi:hypothetical protein